MKKIINEIDLKNKRIILRCDFNVPIEEGIIKDTSKIDAATKTINYLIENNCQIVILSHLGKVKSPADKEKYTLKPVYEYLKTILPTNVYFYPQPRSLELEQRVNELHPKEVLLLENTRYEDYPDKLESSNDPQLSLYWASLGDIFVLDAFASSHRAHASTCGIAKYLPSCFGFLINQEITMLTEYVLHAKHPFTIIMGGAKMDDKLPLIKNLIKKCDYMLMGGALANTCLKVLGYDIGSSLASTDSQVLKDVYNLMNEYHHKIILPTDVIIGRKYDQNFAQTATLNEITVDDVILDIGLKTITQYRSIIETSKVIFLNGTIGKYEDHKFANGTKELLATISNVDCIKVAGGGDALSAINNENYQKAFTYLSTGGGATLEYLANNGSLIALEEIEKENDMKYLVANLKSNKDLNGIQKYINDIKRFPKTSTNLIICPSSCFLPLFNAQNYSLGSQDISIYENGSFTGEINNNQLKSLGVTYTLVGHSERRQYFSENNNTLIAKIKNAFKSGIEVVYCIGESLTDYENKNTEAILEVQLASVLNEFTREELKNIIIAYEPVWAIGFGKTPSILEIESVIAFIKKIILDYYELELPVIYGGSVSLENIAHLKTIESLDGLILGGTSLDTNQLFTIVNEIQLDDK